MISWVQGTTVQGVHSSTFTVALTPTAGNLLIVSVGTKENLATSHGLSVTVSDNRGDIWLPPITSPCQVTPPATPPSSQLLTFVAPQCAGGATTITIHPASSGYYAVTVDEYSGASGANPIHDWTFASTLMDGSETMVDSGPVSTLSGELIYSAGFADLAGETFTASMGFTQRQLTGGSTGTFQGSIVSYDMIATGGSVSNTVTPATLPNTIHVTLLALSPTNINNDPLVQYTFGTASSITGNQLTVTYLYPNTSGNLLIAAARMVERTDAQITDTLDNNWTVVYADPTGLNDTLVMAYCINCNGGGPNTVKLIGAGGGDDTDLNMIIAEYKFTGTFNTSSKNRVTSGTVIDTGNVPTNGKSLLVSMFGFGNIGSATPNKLDQLATLRTQYSEPGFFFEGPATLALADQVVTTPGIMGHNTFTSSVTGHLNAAILGFTFMPPQIHVFVQSVGLSHV